MKRYITLLIMLFVAASSHAVELMKWERIPLQVKLNVDQERIVFLDKNVRVGFPASLNGKLRVQSTGGAVYLLASEAFPVTRLQLQNVENGELILLDIIADKGNKVLEPIKVIYQGSLSVTQQSQTVHSSEANQVKPTEGKVESKKTGEPLPIALTRYAAQMLYAPERTIESLPGVQPTTLRLPAKMTTLLPTQSVDITPLAGWSLEGYHVVALKITNQRHQEKIVLDPRQLQGKFVSATFQHRWLGHKGSAEDTTVLYLVIQGEPEKAFIPEFNSGR